MPFFIHLYGDGRIPPIQLLDQSPSSTASQRHERAEHRHVLWSYFLQNYQLGDSCLFEYYADDTYLYPTSLYLDVIQGISEFLTHRITEGKLTVD